MDKNMYNAPEIESERINELSAKLLEVTNALQQSNKELLRVQKEREEMLSNISHDLRAPLTAIRSAVDCLSITSLTTEERNGYIATIDRRMKTLENLVSDMYYLFCVEDSGKKLDFQVIDAAPFFEEYYIDATTDDRYAAKDMQFEMDEMLDARINIDIQKIIRVLDNLFTNAAKYSNDGAMIKLSVTLDNGFLCVSVKDTGIGIPEKDVKNVFGRTFTVSTARTPNSATGSGLGLSICKAIVERHGGSISCESVLGEGTCFNFTLPIVG